jgi:hypothetical protein
MNDHFEKVKTLVLTGLPVYKALRKLKINSNTFYRNITEQQKLELQQIKTSFAIRGIYGKNKM